MFKARFVGGFIVLALTLGCGEEPRQGTVAVLESGDSKGPAHPSSILDLDVDTNRNGIVENVRDEEGEDAASLRFGALFLVNNDNDATESKSYPDNFIGGRDYNLDLQGGPLRPEPDDGWINGPRDVEDVTPFVVRVKPDSLGVGDRILLRVATVHLREHIRIFPDRRPGSRELVGPGSLRRISTENRSSASRPDEVGEPWTELDVTDRFATESSREFGLEGVSYRLRSEDWDGVVSLEVEIRDRRGATKARDRVQLMVAPFLLSSNLEETNLLFLADGNRLDLEKSQDALIHQGNQELVARLKEQGNLPPTLPVSASGGLAHPYPQDLFELGFSSVPSSRVGAAQVLPVLLVPGHASGPLLAYRLLGSVDPRRPFAHSAVGTFDPAPERSTRSDHFSDSGFFGGNFELFPPTSEAPWGRAIRISRSGKEDPRFVDFLNAQALQGPVLEFENDWLRVGHIDELFSFVPTDDPRAPGGGIGTASSAREVQRFKVVMPSPRLALEILAGVQADGWGDRGVVSAGVELASAEDTDPLDWRLTVDEILGNPLAVKVNRWIADELRRHREFLQEHFSLRYDPENPAQSDILEVPLLFRWTQTSEADPVWDEKGRKVHSRGGQPLNPNPANLLVVRRGMGCSTILPDPKGPRVDGEDRFWSSIDQTFRRGRVAGVWDKVESLGWHSGAGGLHCGTNVRRRPGPRAVWWSFFSGEAGEIVSREISRTEAMD